SNRKKKVCSVGPGRLQQLQGRSWIASAHLKVGLNQRYPLLIKQRVCRKTLAQFVNDGFCLAEFTADSQRIGCQCERKLTTGQVQRVRGLVFHLAAITELRVPHSRSRSDLRCHLFQI